MQGPSTASSAQARGEQVRSPALDALRAATRRAHAQAEHSSPLLRADFTLAAYRTYLLGTAHFVAAAEQFAGRAEALPHAPRYAWSQVRRLPALLADMRHSGCTPVYTETALFAHPRTQACADALRRHADGDGAGPLGVLYVLEGSTLGGQVLAKHLRAHLQLGPEQLAYLRGPGSAARARWNATCSFLERMLDGPQKRQRAAAAAVEAFALSAAAATDF